MALIFPGKTKCPLCGRFLDECDDIVAFPAFVRFDHELGSFSDAAFHRECFDRHPKADDVRALYARYRAIWDSRPKDLKTLEEMEAWGREAFKDFT